MYITVLNTMILNLESPPPVTPSVAPSPPSKGHAPVAPGGPSVHAAASVAAHELRSESCLLVAGLVAKLGPAAHPEVASWALSVAPGGALALGAAEIVSSLVAVAAGLCAAKVVHPHAAAHLVVAAHISSHTSTIHSAPAHVATSEVTTHVAAHSTVHSTTKVISTVAEVALVASEHVAPAHAAHVAPHARPGSGAHVVHVAAPLVPGPPPLRTLGSAAHVVPHGAAHVAGVAPGRGAHGAAPAPVHHASPGRASPHGTHRTSAAAHPGASSHGHAAPASAHASHRTTGSSTSESKKKSMNCNAT